jgi:hypothetical protein
MRVHSLIGQLTAILFFCSVSPLQAKQMEQYSIKLDSLKAIKQQERLGDELYVSISEFTQGSEPRHYQIPAYPAHWVSKYLNQINHLTIWQRPLNQCESTDVVISLVEEDFGPWSNEDLIGSVRLHIRCDNGKMTTHWDIPNKKITTPVNGKPNVFTFSGNNAKYEATFSVSEFPTTKPGPLPHEERGEESSYQQSIQIP